MDQKTRIKLVTGLAIFLGGIFIAYFLSPLIASAFMPSASTIGDMSDISSMMDQMGEASRTAQTSRTVSIVALILALAGMIYSAIVAGSWFISAAQKQ